MPPLGAEVNQLPLPLIVVIGRGPNRQAHTLVPMFAREQNPCRGVPLIAIVQLAPGLRPLQTASPPKQGPVTLQPRQYQLARQSDICWKMPPIEVQKFELAHVTLVSVPPWMMRQQP